MSHKFCKIALILTLMIVVGGILASYLTPSDPLRGRWALIYTSKMNVMQINIDSLDYDATGAELWIRDDFTVESRPPITILTKILIDCQARSVIASEIVQYDASMNEVIRLGAAGSIITPSTLAAFAFVCPNVEPPLEKLPAAPTKAPRLRQA